MSLMQMSLAGGCVILAAILIRWMGRDRLPLGTFSALWALAALRLTVPVGLPFRFSAWTLLTRRLPAPAAQFALTPAAGVPAASKVDITHLADPASPPAANLSPWVILWAAGACALALALAICYIRTRCRFRDALPADNACTGAWLREHPCRRRIRICVSAGTDAPLTYGLFRPVILFPVDTDWSNRDQLNFVFVHELAHIRRFDAARKLALAVVLCLHWFNPLVWVMALLAGRDMERACDRAVVTAFGPAARGDYARTLLDMEQRRGGVQMASGFAKNAIEERIHSIMKIRPRSFLSAALALALVLCVGAVFATAAPEDKADGIDPIVLSGDVMQSQDGTTVYVFTAEGKPVSMTQEEYKLLFADPVEVEWWTAEEYAQWLEQEKEDLQNCLGQRAWTNADGWFTWTQEKIDQTIEMYEQVLDEIKNGLLVSKAVDGRADVMLMQGDGDVRDYLYDNSEDGIVMYKYNDEDDGWIFSVMTQAEAGAMQEQNDAIAAERQQLEQQQAQLEQQLAQIQQRLSSIGETQAGLAERLTQWEDALAPYAPFGLTYEYDEQTDDVRLYWNGQRVRGLYDGTAGVWITGHSGDGTWPQGTPELIAVYTGGALTGLRLATEEEQAQWDWLREGADPSDFTAPPAEEETDDSVSASAPDASPTDASLPVRDTDGTAAVPANNVVVSGDGGPYDQRLESGGRVTVAEDVYAAPGNIVAFGITTRTDAVLTVGLRCGEDDISQRVELDAGKIKMVTFYPEKAGAYELYLANPGEYGEDLNVSWALC